MKSILISAKNLKIGGIEKSLITLINYLVEHGYKVTLVLEKKEGELLKEINPIVKFIEYTPCSINFFILRKLFNFIKKIIFSIKYKNKYDVSISYATYLKSGSFVARTASKHSILWCHADYMELFNKDIKKIKKFFNQLYYYKFSKIIFVSKTAKENFKKNFPNKENIYFCNNLINSKEIYLKVQDKIQMSYNSKITTFLNVGRHDEKQKRLTRIINASDLLKQNGYNFKVIFVGDGQDSSLYKKMVQEKNLKREIIFIGEKENPYPYFNIADCVILSSDYEGYPVVFLESYILNKPIITTNVSDFTDIKDGKGIVTGKNDKEIYIAMKSFIENGYKLKKKFDEVEYNNQIKQKLDEILNQW